MAHPSERLMRKRESSGGAFSSMSDRPLDDGGSLDSGEGWGYRAGTRSQTTSARVSHETDHTPLLIPPSYHVGPTRLQQEKPLNAFASLLMSAPERRRDLDRELLDHA